MASGNNKARNLLRQEKNKSDALGYWVPNRGGSLHTQLMLPPVQTGKMNRTDKGDNFVLGRQFPNRVQLLAITKTDGNVQKFLVGGVNEYGITAFPK